MKHFINQVLYFRALEVYQNLLIYAKICLIITIWGPESPWYIQYLIQIWNIPRMAVDGWLEDRVFCFIHILTDILSMMDSLSRYYEYQKLWLLDLLSYVCFSLTLLGLVTSPCNFQLSSISQPTLSNDKWLLELTT